MKKIMVFLILMLSFVFAQTTTETFTLEGSTEIVKIGIITTGTWNATAIADAYIPNDITIAGTSASTNTDNAGTAGTNVTAVEYGDGFHHITVLTLTNTSLGTPNAGNNLALGALIYTFPAGTHVHYTTYSNVGFTAGTEQTDTPDVGIGSVIGSGVIALLNGGTMEDYITGQTWASTLDGTAEIDGPLGATAGILTGISLNASGASKAVNLNAADGWHASIIGNLTANGTVILVWDFLE